MRPLPWLVVISACARPTTPFALRDPFVVDPDTHPVSVACRAEPSKDDPAAQNCAPREYISPFIWDQVDNLLFARISRAASFERHAEARNINSLDEVADSSWFTNRQPVPPTDAPGSCRPEDMLPAPETVAAGTWVVDHGKDNGSTLGFRVDIPGKGKYMLKADDPGKPERATAASVIGSAIYDELGFNSTCDQLVSVKRAQLSLKPKLVVVENSGVIKPFDEAALGKVLASATQLPDGSVRLHASKWLEGAPLGPFRYIATRADDPNDVIDHADRRELRGSRLLAAWLDHWDAREQNSMDMWLAVDAAHKKSSPGYVKHFILDTSDIMGEELTPDDMARRLGHSYEFDTNDIGRALVTFGIEERPWDRARHTPGREKFGYFSERDFDPTQWRPFYPNPAFLRMTERDGAWMARKIARFTPDDLKRILALGRWSDPSDAAYLLDVLLERQRLILARYLTRLSPLGEVRTDGDRICATDLARLRGLAPPDRFHYSVIEHSRSSVGPIPVDILDDGRICFTPRATQPGDVADTDDLRRVDLVVRNGLGATPLVIHTFDLGPRGMKVVGLTR